MRRACDLVAAEDVGEFFPGVRGVEEFGGVLLGEVAGDGEAEEHLEAGDVAEDGGDGEFAVFLEELEIAGEGLGGGGGEGGGDGVAEGLQARRSER